MAATASNREKAHTFMLGIITLVTVGTFTLVWNDHEKIWEHEVRLTVVEKAMTQNQTGGIDVQGFLPFADLPKKLKEETY